MNAIHRLYDAVRERQSINQGYGIFYHPLFPRVCDAPNCTPPKIGNVTPPGHIDETFYAKEAAIETAYDELLSDLTTPIGTRMEQYTDACEKIDNLYKPHAAPPRTRHCRDCQQCRPALSHHCAFVQTCIYEETYPPYIAYLLTSFVSMVITAVGLSWDLVYYSMYATPSFPLHMIKLACTLMAIGLAAFLGSVLVPHLFCLYDNIEFGTRAKYAHILDNDYVKVPSPWDFKPKFGFWLGTHLNLRYRVWSGIDALSCWLTSPMSTLDLSSPSRIKSVPLMKGLLEVLDTLACFCVPMYFALRRRQQRQTRLRHPKHAHLSNVQATQRIIACSVAKGLHFPDLHGWTEDTRVHWTGALMTNGQMKQPLDMRTSHRITHED